MIRMTDEVLLLAPRTPRPRRLGLPPGAERAFPQIDKPRSHPL